MDDFVHLHVHTQYSALDGLCKHSELVNEVAKLGQSAVAMTDHGNHSGMVEHWRTCTSAGVKPIIGEEVYVESEGRRYGHMTLLAMNDVGLSNLHMLSHLAADNVHYKPQVKLEWLEAHSEGLIATTGCPSGEFQYRLRTGDTDAAESHLTWLQGVFEDRLYIEIMDHANEVEKAVSRRLYDYSIDRGVPLLPTNDVHYVHEGDAKSHELLLCCQTGSTMSNPNRFKFDGVGYHVRSRAEMERLFDPAMLDNTLRAAERCNITMYEQQGAFMPYLPNAEQRLRDKISNVYTDPVYVERLEYEYKIICDKGYASYFLFVAEAMEIGLKMGIRFGPGRGSGGGSLIAYVLGITAFDPIPHNCFFERFLNPERDSLPDFDVDIQSDRRHEFLAALRNHYGADYFAYIGTFGTLQPLASLERVSKALERHDLGIQLKKALPPAQAGFQPPLSVAWDEDHEQYEQAGPLRSMLEHPAALEVYESAMKLEGVISNSGTHAGGVVISPIPIHWIAPMSRNADGINQVQLSGPDVESIGLVKMDFLGLSMLSILEQVRQSVGYTPTDALATDIQERVFERFCQLGEYRSIFQLSGDGISDLAARIQPRSIDMLADIMALYRPGPLAIGADDMYAINVVESIHPELDKALEPILASTRGVIIYQEQIMEIVQKVCGFSLGEADVIRRAMGKKKIEVLEEQRAHIMEGGKAQGYTEEAMQALWDAVLPFAKYGFNRCVAGDTRVHGINGAGLTVAEIYDRLYVDDPQHKVRNSSYRAKFKREGGLSTWSVGVNGRTQKRRIIDVHYNGERPTYKITTADGNSITATDNHRHWTPGGWKRVDELSVGDSLMRARYDKDANRDYDYNLCSQPREYNGARLPNSDRQGVNALGYVDGSTLALREWTAQQEWVCSKPGCNKSKKNGDRIERAHLDGNRKNNAPDNLAMLCAGHHKEYDYAQNGRLRQGERGLVIYPVEIVSIEYAGVQDVYDVEVESDTEDGHSWMANGYLTHNSHSVAYAYIAYETMYCRAMHPAEWWAAVIDKEKDKAQLARWVSCARSDGVRVEGPGYNGHLPRSWKPYDTPEGPLIVCGYQNISGMPSSVHVRSVTGTMEDFVQANCDVLTPRILRALEQVGAFDGEDSLWWPSGLTDAQLKKLITQCRRSAHHNPLLPLGKAPSPESPLWPVTMSEPLDATQGEVELLGVWLSHHPLRGREIDSQPLLEGGRGTAAVLAVEPKTSKSGRQYNLITLSTPDVSVTRMCFLEGLDIAVGDVVDYLCKVRDDLATIEQIERTID